MTLLITKLTFYNQLASFYCLLSKADEFKEIQNGGFKMADTKMAILSLIYNLSA